MTQQQRSELTNILAINSRERSNGKSYTIINGLKTTDRPIWFIVHNHYLLKHFKDIIKNPQVKIITVNQLNDIRGSNYPIILDHVVLEELLFG